MKYVVKFRGFHYVEADSIDEANEKVMFDDVVCTEMHVDSIEEVDDFTVCLEE